MAKPRGRPKGSGNPEDEPILRDAFKAHRDGKFKSERAAAMEYGKQLPGDPVVNGGRIYRKLRARRAELEAELHRDQVQLDATEELTELFASELAGMPPGFKADFLYRHFKILVENAKVVDSVLRSLEEDGLEISADFLTYLARIAEKIVEKERAAFEASPVGRYLRRQLEKEQERARKAQERFGKPAKP